MGNVGLQIQIIELKLSESEFHFREDHWEELPARVLHSILTDNIGFSNNQLSFLKTAKGRFYN